MGFKMAAFEFVEMHHTIFQRRGVEQDIIDVLKHITPSREQEPAPALQGRFAQIEAGIAGKVCAASCWACRLCRRFSGAADRRSLCLTVMAQQSDIGCQVKYKDSCKPLV